MSVISQLSLLKFQLKCVVFFSLNLAKQLCGPIKQQFQEFDFQRRDN